MSERPVRSTTPADAHAVAHVFVDELAERCAIAGTDGHHLQRARRLRAGEQITAADDTGAWRMYEVVEVGRGLVRCEARGAVRQELAPAVSVALAIALTKGGLDAVIASVTELGVARITPVRTERTVVRWDTAKTARAIERLHAVGREAAMQCRRSRLPRVDDEVIAVADLASRPAVVVVDRTGSPAYELTPPDHGEWTLVVGPEGGLTPADLKALVDQPRLTLGNHVLRAGTAPVAGVAIMSDRIAQMRHP